MIKRLVLACALCMLAGPPIARAQSDSGYQTMPRPADRPDLWEEVQDGVYQFRLYGGGDDPLAGKDTIPRSWFSAAYFYEMVYDPDCRVRYTVTEFKRNGARVKLLHWKDRQVYHVDAWTLSYNSRTVTIPVVPGDTLSCFREFMWYNPGTHSQDTANYAAADTLDFSIELVSATTNQRLALLDTLGCLANASPGAPVMYGMRPIMANVDYIVPSSLGSDSAFLRVLLYPRGSGKYHFMREDRTTVGWSNRLTKPNVQSYLRLFSHVFGKEQIDPEIYQGQSDESTQLTVVTHVGNMRDVDVVFTSAPDGGETSLAIYDANGTLVFAPYVTPRAIGRQQVHHRFESGGAYIVVLYHDGRVVRTSKITVI